MLTYRQGNETERDHHRREFNLCAARVQKYYDLQSERRSEGYHGAANFYQYMAALWYKRQIEAWNNCTLRVAVPADVLRILNWQTGMIDPPQPGADHIVIDGDLVAGPRVSPDWLPTPIDNEPRCDCGHLFEICNHPNCETGTVFAAYEANGH